MREARRAPKTTTDVTDHTRLGPPVCRHQPAAAWRSSPDRAQLRTPRQPRHWLPPTPSQRKQRGGAAASPKRAQRDAAGEQHPGTKHGTYGLCIPGHDVGAPPLRRSGRNRTRHRGWTTPGHTRVGLLVFASLATTSGLVLRRDGSQSGGPAGPVLSVPTLTSLESGGPFPSRKLELSSEKRPRRSLPPCRPRQKY